MRPLHSRSLGGLSRVDADGYLTGPPELVVEVARSSRKIDLGTKKKDYERAGVPEYVVVELDPDRVHWFVLRNGRYVSIHLVPTESSVPGLSRTLARRRRRSSPAISTA